MERRVRMVVDPKTLPKQLRTMRQEQDVTLTKLAQNMPVSTRTLSRMERGQSDPNLLHLAAWVRLLGYELALVYPEN